MATYRNGEKIFRAKGRTLRSILDIEFSDKICIYIFPGFISTNDIWVKYIDFSSTGRLRTPKHIHWVTDLLIKREHEPDLVKEFLLKVLDRWDQIQPLTSRDIDFILRNLVLSRDQQLVSRYSVLDKFGFWGMEFILHLVELLMLQEKTNRHDAYMFARVAEALLSSDDIYSIVSAATQTRG